MSHYDLPNFTSHQDVVNSMRDPRYKQDQNYRNAVAENIARAAAAGVDLNLRVMQDGKRIA